VREEPLSPALADVLARPHPDVELAGRTDPREVPREPVGLPQRLDGVVLLASSSFVNVACLRS